MSGQDALACGLLDGSTGAAVLTYSAAATSSSSSKWPPQARMGWEPGRGRAPSACSRRPSSQQQRISRQDHGTAERPPSLLV